MTDYILKAVELAEGWEVTLCEKDTNGPWVLFENLGREQEVHSSWQWVKDSLAAQLVRQVDSIQINEVDEVDDPYSVLTFKLVSEVREIIDQYDYETASARGPDRTMNTIRAIVDSKALG